MRVGVITDTHDWLAGMEKAAEIFKNEKVDLIIHCGDWVSPFAIEFFMQLINVPVKSVFWKQSRRCKKDNYRKQ